MTVGTYTLTIYDGNHQQIETIHGLTHKQAYSLADIKRPCPGGTYIKRFDGGPPQFKPYRRAWPKRFSYPTLRRSTKKALKAATINIGL